MKSALLRFAGPRLGWIAFFTLVLLPAGPGSALARDAGAPFKMLWLGSSSAYFHDLPWQVAKSLESAGIYAAVHPSLAGRSGTGVQRYLEPGFKMEYGVKPNQTVLEKIRLEKPDLLVLQVPVNFLAGGGPGNDRQAFEAALEVYTRTVREVGGEGVFYEMGWGKGDDYTRGDDLLAKISSRLKVKVVPCRTAWNRVRAQRPELELHNLPDQSHPGTLGHYLNLSCFVAALSGKPPTGVPKEIAVWRPPKTDEAKAAAEVLLSKAKLNPYQEQLAGWMKRNSVSAQTEKIDPETAAYLQGVAWETWEEVRSNRQPH